MKTYGKVAVRAVELLRSGVRGLPAEAWATAAREVFPHSQSLQDKSCPRATFLGLCEDGWVAGVPAGAYTQSRANKAYAVRAAELLGTTPDLVARGPKVLWVRVLSGGSKVHNAQVDVVLGLCESGLLVRR